jgi:hypothetical protein
MLEAAEGTRQADVVGTMYNLVPFKSFKLKKKKAWRLLPLPLGLAWLAQKWPKIARRAVQKKGAFLESRAVFVF